MVGRRKGSVEPFIIRYSVLADAANSCVVFSHEWVLGRLGESFSTIGLYEMTIWFVLHSSNMPCYVT